MPLAVGDKVVWTSVNNPTFTDTSGNPFVACTQALMTGEVVKNSGGTVETTITTADIWGGGSAVSAHSGLEECPGSFGNAYYTIPGDLCVLSTPTMATNEFQVSSGKCAGGGKVKFIIGSTTIGECEYETGGVIRGDYKTNPSELTVRNTAAGSGASKIRDGFFCPSSGMLKMSFSLETEGGTPILIS